MRHIDHISLHKKHLDARFAIVRAVRDFFWGRAFQEVDAPHIVRLPGQEPYLHPMPVLLRNEQGASFQGYLHTSPEYTMKKFLAAGYEHIFWLGKVFRNNESFGGTHNPEFTMLEWYRAHADFYSLMDDVDALLRALAVPALGLTYTAPTVKRMHMRDLWEKTLGINLDQYLTRDAMMALCRSRGHAPADTESYEDAFYRIFLNEIEPTLVGISALIIHHYPAPMAALARLSASEPGYAERFELYLDGLEVANAFTELTDGQEQRARLQQEQAVRSSRGSAAYAIDEDFIAAVGAMPASAGIALGIDRLVQHVLGVKNIDAVLPLPAALIWDEGAHADG